MSKSKEIAVTETVVDVHEAALAKLTTMSGKIRYLSSTGMTTGPIAKRLNIRYQWVRNVLNTPVTTPKEKF